MKKTTRTPHVLTFALLCALSPQAALSQESTEYCFIELANATGLRGQLQITIDEKPLGGEGGLPSGSSSGAIGYRLRPIPVKASHPLCVKPLEQVFTLNNEEFAVIIFYYVNVIDEETGEVKRDLKLEKLVPEIIQDRPVITLLTIDPRHEIRSATINRSNFQPQPFTPLPTPLPRAGRYRISSGNQILLDDLEVDGEGNHLIYLFPVEGSDRIGSGFISVNKFRPGV